MDGIKNLFIINLSKVWKKIYYSSLPEVLDLPRATFAFQTEGDQIVSQNVIIVKESLQTDESSYSVK